MKSDLLSFSFVCPLILMINPREVGNNNWNRKGDNQYSTQTADTSDNFTHHCSRYHVSVTENIQNLRMYMGAVQHLVIPMMNVKKGNKKEKWSEKCSSRRNRRGWSNYMLSHVYETKESREESAEHGQGKERVSCSWRVN